MSPPAPVAPDQRTARLAAFAALAALFVALLTYRLWNVRNTFCLYDDQIRDWTIAVKSWRDIPLTGAPSNAGGDSLGPIYYWILWITRVVLAPVLGKWPHVGGIGIATVHTIGDLVLVRALARRFASWPLALAAILLIAGPFDTALSAVIWNPPVAVAFVKIAIALVLTQSFAPSLLRTAAVTVAAGLAVQAHITGMFVAAGAVGAVIAAPLLTAGATRHWRAAFSRLRLSIEVIVLLQLPWIWFQMHTSNQVLGPQTAISGTMQGLVHPAQLNIVGGFSAMMSMVGSNILGAGSPTYFPGVVAAVLAWVAFRYRRDVAMLAVTVAPVMAATIVFSAWNRPLDTYWFLAVDPAVVVAMAAAIAALPPTALRVTGVACLVVMVALAPSRFAQAQSLNRLPEYGVLRKGTMAILRQTHELRSLKTTFEMPIGTNEYFMFFVYDGRLTDSAAFAAVIDERGNVRFEPGSR